MKLFVFLLALCGAQAFMLAPAPAGGLVARAAVAPAALPVDMTSADKKAKAAKRKMKSCRA